ncbi:type II secretion system protein GspM [Methylobacterium mesophilicum]|uniref:type II secretion system protein GspM n=1 Tax=Methylobacterium mesophilicum TaxID=39956 RepID=UPI002F2E589F
MTSGITFAAMPDRWRRPLSLGLAALALASAAGSCAAILSGYRDRTASIDALTEDVARLKTVLDQDAHGRPSPGDARDGEAPNILAADPAAAQALIQSRLRTLGADSGTPAVQVEWTRLLPSQIGEAVTAVRASIKLTIPASHVGRVINALESAVPPLLLDEVQIGPTQGPGSGEPASANDGSMTLVLAVRIYAPGGRAPSPARQPSEARNPAPDRLP